MKLRKNLWPYFGLMLKREKRSFNFTNAEDFFVEKHQHVTRCLECKKEVSGNFVKRKFKKENFIKIAYSGNSMDTPCMPKLTLDTALKDLQCFMKNVK